MQKQRTPRNGTPSNNVDLERKSKRYLVEVPDPDLGILCRHLLTVDRHPFLDADLIPHVPDLLIQSALMLLRGEDLSAFVSLLEALLLLVHVGSLA